MCFVQSFPLDIFYFLIYKTLRDFLEKIVNKSFLKKNLPSKFFEWLQYKNLKIFIKKIRISIKSGQWLPVCLVYCLVRSG